VGLIAGKIDGQVGRQPEITPSASPRDRYIASSIGAPMSKVVITKLSGSNAATPKKGASVIERRVRNAETGQIVTIRTLDGGSKTFGNDLTYVFTRNVAKARRENKKVSGVTDRVPGKI
jgi:hypothetical protein